MSATRKRYTAYSAVFKPRVGFRQDHGNKRALIESADSKGLTMRELENQVKNICRGSIASKIGPEGD